MKIFHSAGHIVGGTLLIAGTAVGVGMLALPVATGSGGFIPSAIIYLICWAFMLCTGLLLVEANLWMPKDTSFISMAEKILGPAGRILFWVVYLFLFVTVMIAHASGGGSILTDVIGWNLPGWASAIIYTGVLAPVVYLGAHSVDRLNICLLSGVILCYLAFIAVSYSHVDLSLLTYSNWGKATFAMPILFTAFTYQVIIPTLMTYMERNVKKVRIAVILGSTIPLIIYLIWEFLILGIIPAEGPNGLIEAAKQGQNAIGPLKQFVTTPYLFAIGKYFAFFAITTSYIPLALSFFDFLADGFKWKKDGHHRFILTCLVFGVPLIFALIYPHIFLIALGYAGGISCALLFGLMPPLIVWIGRYIKRYPAGTRQLPGGKPLLALLMVFAFLILAGQVLQQIF
jgi:tyrosine-specific transport protein